MSDQRAVAVRAYAPPANPGRNAEGRPRFRPARPLPPSDWTLVFDTETTTDAAQRLRFGTYQLYEKAVLCETGLFYDSEALLPEDVAVIIDTAAARGWRVWPRDAWVIDCFLRYTWRLGGQCVGFNLPFDLSRIALDAAAAKGRRMQGGFTLKLSDSRDDPRVQVKHLHQGAASIRYTAIRRQRTPRSHRKRSRRVPAPRGHFVDVHTLAKVLLGGRSWSLGALSDHLGVDHRKLSTDSHGRGLTWDYLTYAMRDVQATWECFESLRARYATWQLGTPLEQLYSEASLGKAVLKQMGVQPWRQVQADMPPGLIGTIMSTYYGGRAEGRWRRQPCEVIYADFLSMYPTVCTLMGLWGVVTAHGVTWDDATEDVRELLGATQLDQWQHPQAWQQLPVLVQIQPRDDVLPVRARYDDGSAYTIGLNHLTTDQPLWYTLADCIASTLLTGQPPRVLHALRFQPGPPQKDLRPVRLLGDPAYQVDRYEDDLYRRLIDLRQAIKARGKDTTRPPTARDQDTVAQQALKILANSTSYGIFMEVNVSTRDRLENVVAYGPADKPFVVPHRSLEEPGKFFHPLLATLITGAARLMLALAERLTEEAGLTWAFCDTDSLAIARPATMDREAFHRRARAVTDWFRPLNPYSQPMEVFKWEDANFAADGSGIVKPLICYAVSAKRYALFNLDHSGRPRIRKASAHGLGHLRAPYALEHAPRAIPAPSVPLKELGVDRWQYDVWYHVIQAALEEHPDHVKLSDLPGFDQPAMSRYGASTPDLWHWFDAYNRDKPYAEQVKPFNFLSAFQASRPELSGWGVDLDADARHQAETRIEVRVARQAWTDLRTEILAHGGIRPNADYPAPDIPRSVRRIRGTAPDVIAADMGYPDDRVFMAAVQAACRAAQDPLPTRRQHHSAHPMAPHDKDPVTAAQHAFDRLTGQPVASEQLKTYAEALAPYHLHPESKFRQADYLDRGVTARRHIQASRVELIGKEAHRWEEQFYLAEQPDAQIVYGSSQDDTERLRKEVLDACKAYSHSAIARASGLDRTTVMRILDARTRVPKHETLEALLKGTDRLKGQVDHDGV